MNNVNGLQRICDVLIENPSWSLAHLAAYFNTTEHIAHPKIQDLIDYPDYANLMTPFQVSAPISMAQYSIVSTMVVKLLFFSF